MSPKYKSGLDHRWTPEQQTALGRYKRAYLMRESGMRWVDMAKELGVSATTVRGLIRKWEFYVRHRPELVKLWEEGP